MNRESWISDLAAGAVLGAFLIALFLAGVM